MTLFLLLVAAHAADLEIDWDSEHVIGLSGHRGEANRVLKRGYVQGVGVKTVGDLACVVGHQQLIGSNRGEYTWGAKGLNFPGCTQAVTLDTTETHTLSLPGREEQVAYAIQVCTQDASDTDRAAIAGIRLWGAKIEMGLARRIDTQHQEIVGDCDNNWGKKLECPAGEIITALRAHGSDTTFTGIGASCSKVVAPSAPEPQRPRRR